MPWKQFKKIKSETSKVISGNAEKKVKAEVGLIPKWLLIVVAIFLAIFLIIVGCFWLYNDFYQDKVYAGIEMGGVDLGGKTKLQVRALMQAKADNIAAEGIEFYYQDNKFLIKPIMPVGYYSDQAVELWWYQIDDMTEYFFSLGRSKPWLNNIVDKIIFLVRGRESRAKVQFNRELTQRLLEDYFNEFESRAVNAGIDFMGDKVILTDERDGFAFDYSSALDQLEDYLLKQQIGSIEMELVSDKPEVIKSEAGFLIEEVEKVVAKAPLKLEFEVPAYYQGRSSFERYNWDIGPDILKEWLLIKRRQPNQEIGYLNKGIYLGIDDVLASEYLEQIGEQINTEAKEAKFVIENGKVSEFQSSADGFKLNIEAMLKLIESKFIQGDASDLDLVLSVDKSKITNENVNDFGINELIGVGESDFSGSPVNRRHNITNGAENLNGLLIKPDEEFSLLEALGEINAETGYLPELVIRDGRTIPEYGGGLCQIGTTVFRLAINSGLPITERRNHSYRVSYYEPAGTDATIYDPWPDLKFINDTGNYLLMQTRIEGNDLIFEFWGSDDSREVKVTDPIIYNIKPPAPTKYVESEQLEPGEEKCIERAHNGADAYFKRVITWPEKSGRETKEEVWNSHYVPWQKVCLVGVERASTTTDTVLPVDN